MTPEARDRILRALAAEQRPERPYDEQDAGHLLPPNGTTLDSFDRAFLGACAPLVLAQWMEARHGQ